MALGIGGKAVLALRGAAVASNGGHGVELGGVFAVRLGREGEALARNDGLLQVVRKAREVEALRDAAHGRKGGRPPLQREHHARRPRAVDPLGHGLICVLAALALRYRTLRITKFNIANDFRINSGDCEGVTGGQQKTMKGK